MNRFSEIKTLVNSLEKDFEKFYYKKNAAAGTRVRKGMQDLKSLAQSIRISVQEMKKEEEAKVANKKTLKKKVISRRRQII